MIDNRLTYGIEILHTGKLSNMDVIFSSPMIPTDQIKAFWTIQKTKLYVKRKAQKRNYQ